MSDKITTIITYIASGGTVILSFLNQNAAAVGILIGLFTAALNWWFQIQKIKIEKAKLTEKELKRLQNGDIL